MLLEDLGLLKDKNLKAISIFHPVKEYSGKSLGGGIFLSSKAFKKFPNMVVFYDSSKELTKSLKRNHSIQSIEVSTRGMNLLDISNYTMLLLAKYLSKSCLSKKLAWQQKVHNIEAKIDKRIKSKKYMKHRKILFFIDEITDARRLPPILMVNDSISKFLTKKSFIKTYISPLAYLPWSSKLLKNNYKNYVRVGLVNSNSDKLMIKQLDKLHYNIFYRGVLIPGIRQLYFIDQLMEKF